MHGGGLRAIYVVARQIVGEDAKGVSYLRVADAWRKGVTQVKADDANFSVSNLSC